MWHEAILEVTREGFCGGGSDIAFWMQEWIKTPGRVWGTLGSLQGVPQNYNVE